MADKSKIEWCEATWNPVTGCTKVSPGCKHCYAETMAHRLKAMGSKNYANGFELTLQPHMLEQPLRWKKPRTIFVNSMSDLFHEDVGASYILKVFDIMRCAHWHRFQVLTKRHERLSLIDRSIGWPANVWQGVSIENTATVARSFQLAATGARVKFLSIEPLLESIPNLSLLGIDWVIVGGESGPKARPMAADWVREIRDICVAEKVPFFFKQWGGVNKKANGRMLDGRTWDEMPVNR